MLEQSKEYLAAVKSPQRQVDAKFTLNNRVYTGTQLAKIDYDHAIVSGTSYTFGGAYVAGLTAEIKELVEDIQEMMPATAEIGISVNGETQYKPLGQFFVTDIELDRNTNSAKLKLQDGFCKLNGEYQSRLSYPTTARAVFSEICQRCNISTMPMNIPDTIILGTKLEKTSYREAVQYIAQLVGSYAIFNRKGQLEFRNIQKLSYRVNRDNYVMGGFKRKEIQFRLNGIECEVSNNQKLITGTSSGNVAKLNNPWMTQMYLDELFSKVQGFQFYPYSLNFQGDPCLDVGDWIEVEYAKGEYFQAPILVQKISFDGGLSSEISANTLGVSDVVYQYKSPLARKVEFIEGRLSADGLSQVYSGLDEPNHEHLKKGDTWFKPNGTDVEIWMYNGEKWEEVASPEVFRQLQADFEALDKQAKEAFDDVTEIKGVKIPAVERLAKQADDAAKAAEQALTTATTNLDNAKIAMQNATKEFTDSLEQTKTSFTEQIGGLTVGGRNLFLDAAFKSEKVLAQNDYTVGSWHVWDNKTSYSLVDYNNLKYFKYNAQQSEYRQGIMQFFTPETLQRGRTHSVRTFVKVSQSIKMAFNVIKKNNDGSFDWYFNVKTFDIQPSDNFSEMKWQFKIPDTDDGVLYGVAIVNVTGNVDCDIRIYKPMLEAGTLFSDFVLAPEDYNNDLSNMGLSLTKTITESLDHRSEEFAKTYLTKADNNTWLNGSYKTFHDQTSEYIQQSTSAFETLGTDVGNAKTDAQNALTSASNAVSAANAANTMAGDAKSAASGAVSTANDAMDKAKELINKVSGFESKVTTYETNYKNDKQSFTQETQKITTIQNKLDNMYIGGRNLFIDAGFKKEVRTNNNYDTGYWYSYVGTKFNYPKYDDDCKYLYFTASNDNNLGVMQFFDTNKLIKGQTYSVRTQVKVDANTTFRYQLIKKNQNSSYDWYFNFSDTTVTTIGEWVDVKWTFTIPKDDDAMRYGVAIRNLQTGTNVAIRIMKPKLEIGNMYTGFSLAPEDTQNQIDTISNDLSNNYYSKNQINTEVINGPNGVITRYTQDITNRLLNYYTTSQIDSKINIDGEGISEYVKRTQSQLNNLSIGNENLLADAAFKDKIAETNASNYVEGKWVKYNGGTIDIWKYSNEINGIQFTINKDTQLGVFQMINANYMQVGKEYCLRFYVFCRKPLTVRIRLGIKTGDTINWHKKVLDEDISKINTYVEVGKKFKLEDFGAVDKYIVSIYIQADDTNTGTDVWIMKPKLEQGNVFTNFSISTLSLSEQGLSIIKRADKMETTLYDSATGLVTKTTQLAGKYAIQNLNSYGDVLSSLNLNGGNVRIKGELIKLDGNVLIQDAFVNNLKANSILATEITAKATTVINARIVNLDASYITSGTLSANKIYGGTLSANNGAMYVNLDSGYISFYDGNIRTSYINNNGQYFYKDGRYIGKIGTGYKSGDSNVVGIANRIEDGDYITWSYKENKTDDSYTTMITFDPKGKFGGEPGIRIDTDLYLNRIKARGGTPEYIRVGTIRYNTNNYSYPWIGNDSGKTGIMYGGNWLYFLHDNYVYSFEDVKKLINALIGLGTLQLPTSIDSDGTVSHWYTVTL